MSDLAFLAGDSWEVAPLLLGWRLESRLGSALTSVEVTEVEAYDQTEPAAHSFRGPTPRTATMFGRWGRLYVYRSYGVHWCCNVSTGPVGHGAAVLLRAGTPAEGLETMVSRRGRSDGLVDGPGKITQALGIEGRHDGLDLTVDGQIRLVPGRPPLRVESGPRVGITKAMELPWRFWAIDVDEPSDMRF